MGWPGYPGARGNPGKKGATGTNGSPGPVGPTVIYFNINEGSQEGCTSVFLHVLYLGCIIIAYNPHSTLIP